MLKTAFEDMCDSWQRTNIFEMAFVLMVIAGAVTMSLVTVAAVIETIFYTGTVTAEGEPIGRLGMFGLSVTAGMLTYLCWGLVSLMNDDFYAGAFYWSLIKVINCITVLAPFLIIVCLIERSKRKKEETLNNERRAINTRQDYVFQCRNRE